jgi:NAD+ kinase
MLLVAHTGRRRIREQAAQVAHQLLAAGFEVRMLAEEAGDVACDALTEVSPQAAAVGAEVVLALGGDGTFLRAAEFARPAGVAMLGVNLGHVGFLAEADPQALPATVDALVRREYTVDERITVDADIIVDEVVTGSAWALNEVSLERTNRARMLEIAVAVDSRPLLRFGCDGVLCSTPTGSTAYAFSAGGPIIWPNVDALLIVPTAAHALFTRPLVVEPSSVVDIDLLSLRLEAVLSCDGRRAVPVPPGARVQVRRGAAPVRIARLGQWGFTDRLVSRFQLPVRSFRDGAQPTPGSADRLDPSGDTISDGYPIPDRPPNSAGPPVPDSEPGPDERVAP